MKQLTQTNYRLLPLVLSSSALLAFSAPAHSTDSLDPVIVTATRTAQTADETLSPLIIISREEIEANTGGDLSHLLRMHAGIDIGRNGGPGQQTSIFIRGAESNHTLMMIDGVKINPGNIGAPQLQNIRLNMVERVEVVKGPRSTLYGSDAIGGVINIITRKGEKGTQLEVSQIIGSYSTKHFSLSALGQVDKTRFGITANEENSQGYPSKTTSSIDRGYDNTSLHAYVGQQYGKADVELSHWYSDGTTEYLDFFLNPVDQDYKNTVTAVDIKNQLSDEWLSKLKLSRIEDRIDQNQSVDFVSTSRHVVDWQNDVQITDNQLISAGLYLSREHTASSSFGTTYDIHTDVNALFIQDDIQWGKHHVIAGIRATDHEAFSTQTTWNLEYGYTFSPRWRMTMASNSGFRAADATDRFGFGGNPDLKPEESENLELGLRYKNGAHKVNINVFENQIENLIVYNTITSQNENVDKATITGVEAQYQYSTKHWHLKTELIRQNPENDTTGKQLARRAKRSITASVDYVQPDYRIGAQVLNTSDRPDSDFSTTINSGYTLANLNSVININKQLSLQARIDNVFDKKYEVAAGFKTPERSYYLGLKYQFQ